MQHPLPDMKRVMQRFVREAVVGGGYDKSGAGTPPSLSSPNQKPKLITSCEYASRVTMFASGIDGAGWPENRVNARSKLCQKTWTGVDLPVKRPRNSSKISSTATKV